MTADRLASGWRLLARQVGWEWRIFWRTPISAFFTFVFPLMFLVLFNLLFSGSTFGEGTGVAFAQGFTPAIAVFALVTSCYTSLAIGTAISRDEGVLKRAWGTPLPKWAYLGGRIGATVVIGLFSVAVMFAVGAVFYDVVIPWERVPLIVLLLVIGAGCFASLGVAVAGLTPNGQAAPAITNATLLPLAFISGVFFPLSSAPEWLSTLASIFPLRPMVEAVSEQFNPVATPAFPWAEIGVMVAWGVLGVILAARFFTWEPRAGGARRRRRAPEAA